jgi:hypothetical protein
VWKPRIIGQRAPIASASWGVNAAKGLAGRRGIAGWSASCPYGTPVACEGVPPFRSSSKQCPVYAKVPRLICAGACSTSLCLCPLPRDQIRDHHFIASEQIDISRPVEMVTKKHPKQRPPREDCGEKALDGTIATTMASPAGQAQHRHTACYDQERTDDPTQLAYSRHCYVGSEALAKCYNVHHGLLRRLLRVAVVVTTTLRQFYARSPVRFTHFGEGIDYKNNFCSKLREKAS